MGEYLYLILPLLPLSLFYTDKNDIQGYLFYLYPTWVLSKEQTQMARSSLVLSLARIWKQEKFVYGFCTKTFKKFAINYIQNKNWTLANFYILFQISIKTRLILTQALSIQINIFQSFHIAFKRILIICYFIRSLLLCS